jgi:penicillin-binding protein 1B
VVYAAAFGAGVATPATLLEDAPLTITTAGQVWEPQNDDREYRGLVTVRRAIEKSLNVPTARVAMEVGLENVLATARRLGITARLQPFPALSLGAFEVTPVELATVYATIASGGVRRPIHGVTAVLDASGKPLEGEPLAGPERAMSPQVAFLLTSIMQGVVERGTASSLRVQGLEDPLAGKTGTTNGRRDSWFGGFSPGRTTMVWVGYDDNRETRLSGSRAALPIWGRFTWQVRPAGGYANFIRPSGIETATIDPLSGMRATLSCPDTQREVFLQNDAPAQHCFLHGRGWERASTRVPEVLAPAVQELEPKKRSWWKRVFGRKKNKDRGEGK